MRPLIHRRFVAETITEGGSGAALTFISNRSSLRHWDASILAVLLLRLMQVVVVFGQNSPATWPNVRIMQGAEVEAIAVQDDGKIIIGGNFTFVNGVARHYLAR